MKILFPVEVFYPSQAGGAANSVHFITKYLDKSRFSTTVVATDKGLQQDLDRNKWFDGEDGRVIFVKTRSLRFPLRAAWASLRQVTSPDIVHISSIFFPTALVSALAASLLKKKL
jgi:hypothetical protein